MMALRRDPATADGAGICGHFDGWSGVLLLIAQIVCDRREIFFPEVETDADGSTRLATGGNVERPLVVKVA